MSEQNNDPVIGQEGRAYVSILDGDLMLNIADRSIFNLTEQDGRDLVSALTQALDKAAANRGA